MLRGRGSPELRAAVPLFQAVLGSDWERLPDAIRRLHDVRAPCRAEGRARVKRGRSVAARLLASIARFPEASDDVAVSVRIAPVAGGEDWQRTFGVRSFRSRLQRDVGDAGRVVERFGPLSFALRLQATNARLTLSPEAWWCFGIKMPRVLMPVGESYESVDADGRFNFHVELVGPLTGLIVRYRGFLVPVANDL